MSEFAFPCDVCGLEIEPAAGVIMLGGPERAAALDAARENIPVSVYGRWRLLHDECAPSSDEMMEELRARIRDEHNGYLPEGAEEGLEEEVDWQTGSSPFVPLSEMQTVEDVERWTSHFAEKLWFPYTNWNETVSRGLHRA